MANTGYRVTELVPDDLHTYVSGEYQYVCLVIPARELCLVTLDY